MSDILQDPVEAKAYHRGCFDTLLEVYTNHFPARISRKQFQRFAMYFWNHFKAAYPELTAEYDWFQDNEKLSVRINRILIAIKSHYRVTEYVAGNHHKCYGISSITQWTGSHRAEYIDTADLTFKY